MQSEAPTVFPRGDKTPQDEAEGSDRADGVLVVRRGEGTTDNEVLRSFSPRGQAERSASIGFIFAARRAGSIPNTIPTTAEKTVARKTAPVLKTKV